MTKFLAIIHFFALSLRLATTPVTLAFSARGMISTRRPSLQPGSFEQRNQLGHSFSGRIPSSLASTEDDDREYARVRRERRNVPEGDDEDGDDDRQAGDYYSRNARVGGDRAYSEDEESWDYLDEDLDDDDDEDEEDYDLFGTVLIPNPLLDSIDPDGAADRFPELARDPRFWFDMVLFIAFLDFLSYAGPRDPFPDLPMYFPGV
jgi:hypothetical protein